MHALQQFIKILPQKKGVEKSLWVKKFTKKVDYSKEEIAITVYCRENSEEKIFTSNASGWVGAATGKDKNLYEHRGISVSKYRNNIFGNMDWLGREDSNLWMTGPKPVALPLGDSPKHNKSASF